MGQAVKAVRHPQQARGPWQQGIFLAGGQKQEQAGEQDSFHGFPGFVGLQDGKILRLFPPGRKKIIGFACFFIRFE
jgi:hypothetical protein